MTERKAKKKAGTKLRQERPRGGEARAIADLMPDVGRTVFRRFGFVQSSVVTRWQEIVGPRYAHVSMPQSIRFPVGKRAGGTLVLTVTGAYATMMQHVLPEIIERVNGFFGYEAVAKVRIVQGSLPRSDRAETEISRPAASAPAPEPAESGLRDINDPELAAVLGALAAQVAGREK